MTWKTWLINILYWTVQVLLRPVPHSFTWQGVVSLVLEALMVGFALFGLDRFLEDD
jgi:hypothetical protein